MENRIKEQQLHRFADRTSAETMRANQIRWFFSSLAYTLLETLRRLGLTETSMAQAQCPTIRLRLLKIGALVQVTVRRVWVRLASSCPSADMFRQAFTNLDRLRPVMLRCGRETEGSEEHSRGPQLTRWEQPERSASAPTGSILDRREAQRYSRSDFDSVDNSSALSSGNFYSSETQDCPFGSLRILWVRNAG